MKLSLRAILFAAAVVLAGIQSGRAEEISLAPQFNPFQEAASSTSTFDAPPAISLVGACNGCDNGCNSGCCQQPHVGKDFIVCQDRSCSWYATLETLALRPYAGGNLLNPNNTNPAQLGFQGAARFTAGRETSDGLGGRLRYFTYDANETFGAGNATTSIEMKYYDAELTQRVDFRKWGFLASGGLRYLMWDGVAGRQTAAGGVAANDFNIGFDGFGLTFGTEASRAMRFRGGRMVMAARWSALYGNSKAQRINGANANAAQTAQVDDLVNTFEFNIGPQFTRQLRNATLVFGGGLEAQYYSNIANIGAVGAANPLNGIADFGFAGLTSSITLMR